MPPGWNIFLYLFRNSFLFHICLFYTYLTHVHISRVKSKKRIFREVWFPQSYFVPQYLMNFKFNFRTYFLNVSNHIYIYIWYIWAYIIYIFIVFLYTILHRKMVAYNIHLFLSCFLNFMDPGAHSLAVYTSTYLKATEFLELKLGKLSLQDYWGIWMILILFVCTWFILKWN